MKTTRYAMLASLVVYSMMTIQISCSKAPVDSGAAVDAVAPVPTTQPTALVKIDNFNFQPKELKIAVGTNVTWQNGDDVPHTASSKDDPQTFDSGALDTDGKFCFTFTRPGKYEYYCKVHTHMTGVVIVK